MIGAGGLAAGAAKPGRYRRGRARPQFSRYVTLRRDDLSLNAQRGDSFVISNVYALKASRAAPTGPGYAPPATASDAPRDAGGWKAWWTSAGITEPPTPAEPVVATSPDSPVVWRVRAALGAAAWDPPEIYEARLGADVRERGGGEADAPGAEVGQTIAGFRVRSANVAMLTDDLGSLPVQWSLRSGAEVWDIVEAIAAWEADLYVDLRAVRRESAEGR